MVFVWCDCTDCLNNKDCQCDCGEITIRETFYKDAPARCDDYIPIMEQEG